MNLAYRWFCGLGLEGTVPNHSTFSKNRHGPGEKPPKAISLADPSATWKSTGGLASFTYATNCLIDLPVGTIVDVEASAVNKRAEVNATRAMMERIEEKFELKPKRLAGETAYGSEAMLGWLVEDKQILPSIPVQDKTEGKPELFGRSAFLWERTAGRYFCPAGHSLQRNRRKFKKPRSGITKDNTIIYRASPFDCVSCPWKTRCCPKEPARKIHRSIHEDARDLARALSERAAYAQAAKDRKKVEVLFAHLKRILKLNRLRLRGLSGANDEFLLAATAQNLRRMARLLSQPPPNHRIGAPA